MIRPLLACKWIDERKCPPPVLFDRLRESVLKKSMQDIVEQLLQQKVKMKESELGVRVDALNDYIKEQLSYYKSKLEAMQDDRKSDWKDLNEMFLKTLKNRTE